RARGEAHVEACVKRVAQGAAERRGYDLAELQDQVGVSSQSAFNALDKGLKRHPPGDALGEQRGDNGERCRRWVALFERKGVHPQAAARRLYVEAHIARCEIK